MANLVLHARTVADMHAYKARPSHALLISGPVGIGKSALALTLAADLLQLSDEARIMDHPYLKILSDDKTQSIPIEAIRNLNSFLARKVPGDGQRVVIIDHADKLTVEAQNALLKMLEEPPQGTSLLLTASSEQSLLPTVRSRAASLVVIRPTTEQLTEYFTTQGFSTAKVRQTALISGSLPGLMHALLHEDTTHPLFDAVVIAREFVQKTTFERLAMVDSLSKDKELSIRVLGLLQQMAHISLLSGKGNAHWQRIMSESYRAASLLSESAQPKLVLTNLMLNL